MLLTTRYTTSHFKAFYSSLYKTKPQIPIHIKSSLSSYTRKYSSTTNTDSTDNTIKLFDQVYERDEWTNINKNIKDKLDRNLLHLKYHPLNHLANKIKHFFYKNYINRNGTPLFSIYDNFRPIVSVEQNFDR